MTSLQRLAAARNALIRAAASLTEEPTPVRLAETMLHALIALAHLRHLDGAGKAIDMAEHELRQRTAAS